jgi:hypothetical protein
MQLRQLGHSRNYRSFEYAISVAFYLARSRASIQMPNTLLERLFKGTDELETIYCIISLVPLRVAGTVVVSHVALGMNKQRSVSRISGSIPAR